ncbi:conserved protein, unknown function [Hepatocystis sp. ex Piliocolobus tephrosceles]|nr:conserved protein, unknown function [Hepatocystis sp. ex Piliocolobus tephrosceles]
MENINKKEILASYLQLCNKNDMVDAVLKYCDDENGVIFNKHPAKNENKFSDIFHYSDLSESNISNTTNSLNLLDYEKSLQSLTNSIEEKYKKSNQNSVRSIAYFSSKNFEETLPKNDKETDNYKSYSLHKIHDEPKKNNKLTREEILNKVKESMRQIESLKGKEYMKKVDSIYDIIDSVCDVIVPEGRAMLLNISENYGYILLEDGTYNFYPLEMININPAYLKKNPLLNLNYSYKDIMLNHTKNITELKFKNAYSNNSKLKNNVNEKKLDDKFLNFSNKLSHLKDYIIKNEKGDNTIDIDNYLVREDFDKDQAKDNELDKNGLRRNQYMLRKGVKLNQLNTVYKIESVAPYVLSDPVNEADEKVYCCKLI